MQIHDEREEEVGVLCHGLVTGAEQLEQLLPVLEAVVMLPNQETHEGELKLGQNLVIPKEKMILAFRFL